MAAESGAYADGRVFCLLAMKQIMAARNQPRYGGSYPSPSDRRPAKTIHMTAASHPDDPTIHACAASAE
jgi:hypothetical protein